MTETDDARVGLYIDFDNIVISRYQQLHGRQAFQRDGIRDFDRTAPGADTEIAARLTAATVDFDAIVDFAASFGTIVVNRAYADWSVPVNASYQRQLMSRAVDLTQLFTTTTRGTKNGADIRLAVDVVEDLFRLADLTHVIIVAGDSDYIALAQKSKRLGRFVVGIGVAGSSSTSLAAACDEFEHYDSLPGVERVPDARATRTETDASASQTKQGGGRKKAAATSTDSASSTSAADPAAPSGTAGTAAPAPTRGRRAKPQDAPAADPAEAGSGTPASTSRRVTVPVFSHAPEPSFDDTDDDTVELPDPQAVATELLRRALQIGHAKGDGDEWLNTGNVKNQMRRMDPSFNEKPLGFRSFSDFLASRADIADLQEDGSQRLIRLHRA
ncbi:NYN domain-containing protein [Herbiconiux moechotypicola]|uniref:HTH OST-type domain-containing protein n=1 Tax=Herbiconiux moechotypicola TaxID=637393 RepID=A0ABN3DLH1_9MICO|nr:NYN domain-containing protein [Herbiconiux moechotypicola]MCS5730156.1 NYN domain-containing protein [Herbiconiux moechotypicola]